VLLKPLGHLSGALHFRSLVSINQARPLHCDGFETLPAKGVP
jgi:hypothetical protein